MVLANPIYEYTHMQVMHMQLQTRYTAHAFAGCPCPALGRCWASSAPTV